MRRCFDPPPAVRYRNAEGLTWDGQGEVAPLGWWTAIPEVYRPTARTNQ